MHAGTLKFRGASQLSTQIVKVSSIKPESAQQGSNRLIRMQVTNAELANGRMEAATTSVNKAAQESPSRFARAANNRTVWEAKSHPRPGLHPP